MSMKAAAVTRSNSRPMTVGPSLWPKSPPPRFVPSEAKEFTTPAYWSRQSADHLGPLIEDGGLDW